jgi:phosphate/sulfate permease
MFKERLKHTGLGLLAIIGACAVAGIAVILAHVLDNVHLSDQAKNIIGWIALTAIVGCVCALLFMLLQGLYYFIKWLIVEPYRAWKKGKQI